MSGGCSGAARDLLGSFRKQSGRSDEHNKQIRHSQFQCQRGSCSVIFPVSRNLTRGCSCTMFDWTEDECLQLIELYQSKALLWDPKHPKYFKKNLKEESWREIACALGSDRSDVDCKNKIVSLLSSHRREKNKTKQSQSSRKGKVCISLFILQQ